MKSHQFRMVEWLKQHFAQCSIFCPQHTKFCKQIYPKEIFYLFVDTLKFKTILSNTALVVPLDSDHLQQRLNVHFQMWKSNSASKLVSKFLRCRNPPSLSFLDALASLGFELSQTNCYSYFFRLSVINLINTVI